MQAAGGAALTEASAADSQTPPPGHGPRSARPRRIATLVAVAAAVLLADAVSKQVITATLEPHHRIVHVLGNVLRLTAERNPGAAFSIGQGATVLFTGVALMVIVVIVRTARRLVSRAWAVDLGLLLGGALGNLGDRLFRSPGVGRGHVVDWIQLPHWPVFNLADSAIVVGGVLAVLLALRGTPLEGPARSAGE